MPLARWTSLIKNARWTWDDTISLGQLKHLRVILNEIVPSKSWTLYGTSLLFNNQTNASLGSDGYDNYQAPQEDGKQLFDRRMWVSGSLKFRDIPRVGESIRCTERVSSVRRVGASVFVSISRETRRLEFTEVLRGGTVVDTKETVGDVVTDELRSLVYKWRKDGGEGAVNGKPDPSLTQDGSETNETSPESSAKNSNSIQPETSNTASTIQFSVSTSQVSRFSALSYNIHKIHYDRTYCLSEGLEDVVVSGPMLVNIMLHSFASQYPDTAVESFAYRMSEPCYVDRDLQLTIEPQNKKYEIAVWEGTKKLCNGTVRMAKRDS
ncbi:hypothetical protein FT663_04931 [Candidozyma haemuli var. vulneris]|uniref:Uncharacterized protein n=1 Tax=Candidozyma haemuli TaxID=45357 RepID=A0A2V1AZP1_9ASCO|nr:hypothetical protein CXQ85_003028 [[Candida] haemuloni]KAF3986316.1 hypothetical protein FT663_04931 [[Candida] haemuloni var. vulneris]KAF3986978.1 hypothetical protein FT662_04257 [[Candida] haemuloni var. vulneris]PVH23294.1 hypothetical protein CXQ85_003028 [[Candida] haemuloni]